MVAFALFLSLPLPFATIEMKRNAFSLVHGSMCCEARNPKCHYHGAVCYNDVTEGRLYHTYSCAIENPVYLLYKTIWSIDAAYYSNHTAYGKVQLYVLASASDTAGDWCKAIANTVFARCYCIEWGNIQNEKLPAIIRRAVRCGTVLYCAVLSMCFSNMMGNKSIKWI